MYFVIAKNVQNTINLNLCIYTSILLYFLPKNLKLCYAQLLLQNYEINKIIDQIRFNLNMTIYDNNEKDVCMCLTMSISFIINELHTQRMLFSL